jgi:hypothetical protein
MEEGPRLIRFRLRVRRPIDVEEHHLADHAPNVTSWQGVIADEGNTSRRQAGTADRHRLIARGLGDPGVEAVGDHIVELAHPGRRFVDVQVRQSQVGKSEFAGDSTPPLDRTGG